MSLFTPNKDAVVRRLVLKLINTHCPGMTSQIEDTRLDNRVNLTVPVIVAPLAGELIQADDAFTAVTSDFSSTGVAVVVDRPTGLDRVILGFRMGEEMSFVRAEAKHLNPMGGGFFQLGFQLLEVVSAGDYAGLESMSL
jgi:hypothetical protein